MSACNPSTALHHEKRARHVAREQIIFAADYQELGFLPQIGAAKQQLRPMSQQSGIPSGTPAEAPPETLTKASPTQPQLWKNGVITGIALFAGFSFLLSILALRPGPDDLADANPPGPPQVERISWGLTSQNALIERDVSPQAVSDMTADANPWSDIGSAKLSELSDAERKKIASASIAQTAAAFQKILPLEDTPGVTLFAVEAAHAVMHSRYRMSNDIDPADQNEAGRALRRRACLGATIDMTLRLGGRYEYVLYDAGGLIVDRFTITENSCA